MDAGESERDRLYGLAIRADTIELVGRLGWKGLSRVVEPGKTRL